MERLQVYKKLLEAEAMLKKTIEEKSEMIQLHSLQLSSLSSRHESEIGEQKMKIIQAEGTNDYCDYNLNYL